MNHPIVEDLPAPADYVSTGDRQKNEEELGPLLAPETAQEFRSRWDRIQAAFVDEPRNAVQQADDLVNSAMKKLTESFGEARSKLETKWSRGDEVSTEDLRVALRQYRAFFQRLLNV
jgi:5'-deoxynucleotidase YfbR-like HD superfamily hydrolase